MSASIEQILSSYDDRAPLSEASTIPAPWYTDPRIAELERLNVFSKTWQLVAHIRQLQNAGDFITTRLAGEPIVVVRESDGSLRAFYNVCRHHAAAVVTQPCGQASILQCPYHGWKYGLDGSLKGMPEFEGVANFERADNGLLPSSRGNLGVLRLRESRSRRNLIDRVSRRTGPARGAARHQQPCTTSNGAAMTSIATGRSTSTTSSMAAITCRICIKDLSSVLDYKQYTIENEDRYCLQSSPMVASDEDAATGATRKGDRAWYFWQYPNLMINCYEGYMDTNYVIPIDEDHCTVIFDFYFSDVSEAASTTTPSR